MVVKYMHHGDDLVEHRTREVCFGAQCTNHSANPMCCGTILYCIVNFDELDSQQFLNRPNILASSFYSNFVQSCLCMSLYPPASLFYHVYIVKGFKLNQRRILQVTGLWLRSSKRKGRVETRESKHRCAT